jgi:uncharacterized protein YjbI with pentapeptide repeats
MPNFDAIANLIAEKWKLLAEIAVLAIGTVTGIALYTKRPKVKIPPWVYWVIPGAIFLILAACMLLWGIFQVSQYWSILQQTPTDVTNSTDVTKKKFDASLEIVKAIVGGVGTFATISGGIVLYLNFRVANKNVLLASQNLVLTESRLITDRFSKAIEQLGHQDVHVRLGAIYSLERIANDSNQDYWPVMEILTSYVRGKSSWTQEKATAWKEVNQGQDKPEIPPLEIDIQAVLTVLNRRKHSLGDREEAHPLDLRSTDLRRADLRGAKKMQGVLLIEAHLEGANLSEAHLEGANLNYAYLEKARLDYAHLEEASLKAANLEEASLYEAHLDKAHIEQANLNSANLSCIHLEKAHLNLAHLEKANLSQANLKETKLCEANLEGANLTRANLEEANLVRANLKEAILHKANLYNAYLHGANLDGANLDGVINLTPEQRTSANPDEYERSLREDW